MNGKTILLTKEQIEAKINRIVHEIHELCFSEEEIIICGIIPGNGSTIAERIAKQLESISTLKIKRATIQINKTNPLESKIKCALRSEEYANKTVVIVDDVSNSGKTLMYAAKYFLESPIKAIRPLVLVDRNHSRYPIKPSFVGMTVSTTLQDHIHVDMNETEEVVYLV
jgi:pyrimidine operon attenuation protein/uracil phosphoribosyltransferase